MDREEGHQPKMRPDRFAAPAGGAPVAEAAGDLPAPDRADRVDCAVVIVTYNSARDIACVFPRLLAAAGLTLRTIVVDNGSADATIDLVRRRTDVRCIEVGANLGYAGGINIGRRHACRYSALLVLNPDLVLEPARSAKWRPSSTIRRSGWSHRCWSTRTAVAIRRCAAAQP